MALRVQTSIMVWLGGANTNKDESIRSRWFLLSPRLPYYAACKLTRPLPVGQGSWFQGRSKLWLLPEQGWRLSRVQWILTYWCKGTMK